MKKLVLFFISQLILLPVFSQQSVKGKITDDKNSPVAGASVQVGWTFSKDLISNNGTGVNGLLAQQWAHVVCTYDHTTKIGTMYINGQEMKSQDFNLYDNDKANATGLVYAGLPANNTFVFGFIQDKVSPTIPDTWADYTNPANGHFKGLLDDVAIYHTVLTQAIITLMYNSGSTQ